MPRQDLANITFNVGGNSESYQEFLRNLSFGRPPDIHNNVALDGEDIDLDDMVSALMQMERAMQKTSAALGDMSDAAEQALGRALVTPDDVMPLQEVTILLDCSAASPKRYSFQTRVFPKDYEGQFAVVYSEYNQKRTRFGDPVEREYEFWAVHPNKLVVDKFVEKLQAQHQEYMKTYQISARSTHFYSAGILSIRQVKK